MKKDFKNVGTVREKGTVMGESKLEVIAITRVTSEADYQETLAIRHLVFVQEQGVPAELEVDAYEKTATFFLARVEGAAVGTGRYRRKDQARVKFERVATLPALRGKGIGAALMKFMQIAATQDFPQCQLMMHAQRDSIGFYEKLGWSVEGFPFLEAGIEHCKMVWKAPGR